MIKYAKRKITCVNNEFPNVNVNHTMIIEIYYSIKSKYKYEIDNVKSLNFMSTMHYEPRIEDLLRFMQKINMCPDLMFCDKSFKFSNSEFQVKCFESITDAKIYIKDYMNVDQLMCLKNHSNKITTLKNLINNEIELLINENF